MNPGMTSVGFALRWMVTLLGFPIGGAAAYAVVRSIDTAPKALIGGLIAGAIIGVIQWLILRMRLPISAWWVMATAVGLGLGLAVAVQVIGSDLDVRNITLRALLAGLCVGIAQWVVLRPQISAAAWWIAIVAVAWVVGWLVTWAARVDLSFNWAVFGASGALCFALLTAGAWVLLLPKR